MKAPASTGALFERVPVPNQTVQRMLSLVLQDSGGNLGNTIERLLSFLVECSTKKYRF
jgi:hypothetical protein